MRGVKMRREAMMRRRLWRMGECRALAEGPFCTPGDCLRAEREKEMRMRSEEEDGGCTSPSPDPLVPPAPRC